MTKKDPSNSDDERSSRGRASGTATSKTDYKVGPGRPPKEHQFKPGQSGNPKGAKRKATSLLPDLKEQFERALNQTVKVTQGDKQRFMSMWAAGVQQLVVEFAKGDRHARRDVFWIAEKLGSEFLTSKKAIDETLVGERQTIFHAYVARQMQLKAASAAFPVLAPPELLDDDKPEKNR